MPLINAQAVEIADVADLHLYPVAELPADLPAKAGVILAPDADLALIEPRFSDFSVIAIEFPKFRDGRGFTLARTLRQRGYQGDLRAIGHFLPDQFLAMQACGFSSFITPPSHDPAQFAAVLAMPHQAGQFLRRSLPRALETT